MVFTKKVCILAMVCVPFFHLSLHAEIINLEVPNNIFPPGQKNQILSPEQQKRLDSLVEKFTQQDLDTYLKQAVFFTSPEFLEPIIHAAEIKKDHMRLFRDTLLYKIPIDLPPFNTIGIYTKDAIKVAILGIVLAHEHALLTYYTNYLVEQFSNHLSNNEKLLTKQELSDLDLKALVPTAMSSVQLHLKQLTTTSCIARHVQHVILQQIATKTKEHYLLDEEHNLKLSGATPAQPLSIFSLMQETVLLEIPLNIPDASLAQMLTTALKNYGLLPSVCNNVLVNGTKDILLNLLFLHYFTAQEVIPRWKHFILARQPELCAAAQGDDTKSLQELIRTNITIPYTTWLQKRHQLLTRWDGYYHGILLLPSLYKWGTWAYQLYQQATQEQGQSS